MRVAKRTETGERDCMSEQAVAIDVPADHVRRLSNLGLRGLRLPRRLVLHRALRLEPPSFLGGGVNLAMRLEIGAFTLINGARVAAAKIGRYCSIAGDVSMGLAEHPLDRITTSTLSYDPDFHGWGTFCDPELLERVRGKAVPFVGGRRFTTVGHDVWIGLGAFIKSGVTIGTGAVIGAGAVVVEDIPPYAIALGVPARVKRYRFNEAQIARLLASRWWEYSLLDLLGEEIRDADRFCDVLQERVAAGTIKPYAPRPVTADTLIAAFGAIDD